MGAKPRRLPEQHHKTQTSTVQPAVEAQRGRSESQPPRVAPGEDERIGAFRRAVLFGDAGAVRAALRGGLDPGTRGKDGHTLLCTAIMEGDESIAELVIDQAPSLEVRCSDESHHGAGSMPLCGAVFRGRVELVKRLLQRGARVDAKLHGGMEALHTAAFVGRNAAIPVLVRAGADVNARSDRGLTPLHYAAHRGSVASARALLSHGADVDAEIGRGTTALTLAMAAEQFDVARVLVRAGARADRIFSNAASAGLLHVIDLLVDADAAVLRQPDEMRAARENARSAGHPELAELLETIERFPVAGAAARRLEHRAYQQAVDAVSRRHARNPLLSWLSKAELDARVEELSERVGADVCAPEVERQRLELRRRAAIQFAAEASVDTARAVAEELAEMVAATKQGSPPKGIDLGILENAVEHLRVLDKLETPADGEQTPADGEASAD